MRDLCLDLERPRDCDSTQGVRESPQISLDNVSMLLFSRSSSRNNVIGLKISLGSILILLWLRSRDLNDDKSVKKVLVVITKVHIIQHCITLHRIERRGHRGE